ncbi:MAG TPA: hypothetical protein P5040_05420 [Smithella sp.]|nr:hypothetical protein [Smithella sp.]
MERFESTMKPFEKTVGVIGATSIIGDYLLPLLVNQGWHVVAFSRSREKIKNDQDSPISWRLLGGTVSPDVRRNRSPQDPIHHWISLGPIVALPDYFPLLSSHGAKRIVAISSTSRFTKQDSADDDEKKVAKQLAGSEEALKVWTKKGNIAFTILRPTMIYDLGRDKNITFIARFIKRIGFFCLLGDASGLRQPVHACDVALACAATLQSDAAMNRSYNIPGGEVLTYREMVDRIFAALNKKPCYVKIPFWLFHIAFFVLRMHPRYRHWSAAMSQRMNQDMVFDATDAQRDFCYLPGPFCLSADAPCILGKDKNKATQ